MALTKNPLIRYKILDQCFRNPGRKYFIEDLISECEKILLERDPDSKGISRRQILDDISFMESSEGWGIPLDRCKYGKRVYFRYSDLSFSINNMPLNEVELDQIQSAIGILNQFQGMPQFDALYELLPKLHQSVSKQENAKPVMSFEHNPFLKGIDLLGELYNAIRYKKVLGISYQNFHSEQPIKMIFHPYYLKEYNSRWFVFGCNPEKDKKDWNLALDRITGLVETQLKYVSNSEIDWEEYFEEIIGVTKPVDKDPDGIVLQFKGITGKYIETKPLHGSQRSKWIDAETLEVKLELIINYEFERLILSYADTVLVKSPETLVKQVGNRLNKAAVSYPEVTIHPETERCQ